MATIDKLPPVNQDPAYLRAQQIRDGHTTAVNWLRNTSDTVHPLTNAVALQLVHSGADAALNRTREDLAARGQQRLDYLNQQFPLTPATTPDMTAADREVMLAAFRTSLREAREATPQDQLQEYRDAVTYGDESRRRAFLAVMVEDGTARQHLDEVAQTLGDKANDFIEWLDMRGRGLISSVNSDGLFMAHLASPLRQPTEARQIDALRQDAGVASPALENAGLPRYENALTRAIGVQRWTDL